MNKYARTTYTENHLAGEQAQIPFPDDITKVDPKEVPPVDVVCAGFPCQSFSNAGRKRGFKDKRNGGDLVFMALKIIAEKRPAVVFLENVEGLRTQDEGRVIPTIQSELAACGYTFKQAFHKVNADDYGVPQRRPRLFIIAFRDHLLHRNFQEPKKVPLAYTLSDVMGGHVVMSAKNPSERKSAKTLRVKGAGSGVDSKQCWDSYIVDGKPRRITVAEAIRIQGLPESFRFPDGITNAQAMKMIGNSVAVPAVHAWAKAIIDALDGAAAPMSAKAK